MALTGASRPDADRSGAEPPEQVLVLRALGLGDALTAVPALRGLRRRRPGARLLLAAHGPAPQLLVQHGVVDEIVPTTGLDDVPPGSGLGPHVAVDLHGRGPQSHRLLLAGRPTALVAFANAEACVAGPSWRADEHEVDRWCRLVDGEDTDSDDPVCERADLRLVTDGTVRRDGPVVVHPGAAGPSRRWPVARFAAVAAGLAADGHRVVVTGSPDEAALAAQVAGLAGLPPDADLAGRLDLEQLASCLTSAALLVCGDTGVAHLGTAVGTPSVLMFGPTPPQWWGPVVDLDRHVVLWDGDPAAPPGDPHGAHPDPALLRVTVPEVLSAARSLLAAG